MNTINDENINYRELYNQVKNINISILESMHDGIYLADGNGITLYVNDAYTKISGIRKDQLIGKHASQLIEEGIYLDSASLEVIAKKKSVSMIDHFKDGRQNRTEGRQCLLSASPVFDEEGNVVRVITNVRDVSDLIELEGKLEESERLNSRYIEEIEKLREEQHYNPEIIANSKSMLQIMKTINIISDIDSKILVFGETGVGKEVVVKEIHNKSKRGNGPFIKVNCGAIPSNLFESELFGYEKGAFSGASNKGKAGMFELADGGTIFLDEIGELPLNVQSKLLRVLQDGEVIRIGGVTSKKVDTRVISATNKDLKELVSLGKFRDDLYYRLSVVPIYIPPLRERIEDIPGLLFYFFNKYNKKYGKNKILKKECIKYLESYEWPGNIRELKNLAERLVVTCEEEVIDLKLILMILGKPENDNCYDMSNEFMTLTETILKVEKNLLERVLEKHHTTRKAALELGISQPTLVRKCQKHNIPLNNLNKDKMT